MLEAEWLFVLREETIFCHTYIHTYIFPIKIKAFCLFQGQFEDPCPRKTRTILFIITYEHYSYKLNSVYSFGGFPV